MRNFKQYIVFIGLIFVLNGLIHYISVKLYGMEIIEIMKTYKNEEIFDFIVRLTKYELLIGFIILSLGSLILLFSKKPSNSPHTHN